MLHPSANALVLGVAAIGPESIVKGAEKLAGAIEAARKGGGSGARLNAS